MKINSINQLVELALSDTKNTHAELVYGYLSSHQALIIEKEIGVNLKGAQRVIDTSGIRHALRKHGSPEKERKRGQIAITIDDFKLIPQILKSPDKIIYTGKNSLNQDTFAFHKKLKNAYIVAECVRFAKKGNKLVFATMYKF